MKRRFMMWMTIIGILVVGGSVTKMTQDFVSSQRTESVTIVNVADAGDKNMGTAVLTEETAMQAAGGAGAETAAGMEHMAEAAAEDMPVEEFAVTEDAKAAPAEAPAALAAASSKAPIDTTKDEAIQETVKSPLDPVVDNTAIMEPVSETVSHHAGDFFERFAQTEQNALTIWENVTTDNRSAYLAAAEQERILWDHELNHVYQVIRERLSKEENEELKQLEIEWIKERDLYAEKAGARSNVKNAQNQNPDYVRALAEKTKERCYWLVSEYESVLNEN